MSQVFRIRQEAERREDPALFYLPECFADPALQQAVFGHELETTPFESGLLARLSAEDHEKLDLWADIRGLTPHAIFLDAHGVVNGYTAPAPPWPAPLEVAVAEAIWAQVPDVPVSVLRGRITQIAVRAQARLNAEAAPAPTELRHRAEPGDVAVEALRHPYNRFFSVEEYDLTHSTFDGARSQTLTRAAFISGDAVVVLPYDPVRDRVLLVEQFRTGPFARGDLQPWSIEAPAGRIDPGETPEAAARREAAEEAGIALQDLVRLPGTYPSPGCIAEYLYNFVAIADLPDDLARLGGLPEEGEDLRIHLIGFDDLLRLIDTGEITNGPLILIALQWDRMGRRAPG